MPDCEKIDTSQFSVCKEPAAALPSSCYDGTDMITIRVKHTSGDTKDQNFSKVKDYIFFRKLLAWHSSYFAAATDPAGGFSTSGAEVLELEGSHKVFDAFHCWIYTGRLMDPPAPDAPPEACCLPYSILYDLWLFADIRGIPSLGNSAIDMLHERWTSSWTVPMNIRYVYENTAPGSKLRAMIVDYYSMAALFKDMKNYKSTEPTVEFLHDVYPRLAERGETTLKLSDMIKLDRCRWHDHSGPGGKQRLESRTKRKVDQLEE